jgi:hypothetical protein
MLLWMIWFVIIIDSDTFICKRISEAIGGATNNFARAGDAEETYNYSGWRKLSFNNRVVNNHNRVIMPVFLRVVYPYNYLF